jgi:ribonucleotide monophosphatase NagD (HAD superfamily)
MQTSAHSHNGAVALPGAVECFNELIAAKKKIVILSNTSRRAKDAKGKLPGLGFDLELITGLVCSGEEAWKHMESEFGGRRCTWLTWEREEEAKEKGDGFLEGLDVTTADVEDADFILCHGYDAPPPATPATTRKNALFWCVDVLDVFIAVTKSADNLAGDGQEMWAHFIVDVAVVFCIGLTSFWALDRLR